jgi:hypothetical protein
MNGSTLALGLTAALAAAGALSQRGGRGPAFGSRAKKAKLFFPSAIEARREAAAARPSVLSDKAFQRWFRGSQVVDEIGEPLVVYHGTNVKFNVFKPEGPHRGGLLAFFATEARFAEGYGSYVYPVYLACGDVFDFRVERITRSMVREFYKDRGGVQDNIEARRILIGLSNVHPQIQIQDVMDQRYSSHDLTQPLFLEAVLAGSWDALECDEFVEFLREAGYDAIVLLEHGSVNYAVFEPQQIKSATGNSGSFDGDDARISYNRVSR